MIPFRQNLHHHVGGACILPETQVLENGAAEVVRVNQADFVLPDVKDTKLSRVLEAGVNLKQVPSRVMASTGDIYVQIGDAVPAEPAEPETQPKE